MASIRCPNCGELNHIKSEYHTFCVSCKKKLAFNYTDWHRDHPDKNFKDFLEELPDNQEEIDPGKNGQRTIRFRSVPIISETVNSYVIFFRRKTVFAMSDVQKHSLKFNPFEPINPLNHKLISFILTPFIIIILLVLTTPFVTLINTDAFLSPIHIVIIIVFTLILFYLMGLEALMKKKALSDRGVSNKVKLRIIKERKWAGFKGKLKSGI